ncbi:hypothetical protein [Natrinema gari]|uniref:Uncharacterized protein n=1 Tax=Natrinema gari JCM 14663 TaxID=1230459 RepID=L9ZCW9_9EURY|nr:hypothetical protein [Natrinema gari]ELY83856.1 hypothetical protein C486_01464 [Natrinema gari JCM 14663]
MAASTWWYGIVPFPVVVLTTVITRVAFRAFVAATHPSTDAPLGAGVAWFVLQTLSFWMGILVAVVVLGCLLADCRALSGNEAWSPSSWWGVAGVVHLGGAVFPKLLLLSVPALAAYLYRRHVRLGRP